MSLATAAAGVAIAAIAALMALRQVADGVAIAISTLSVVWAQDVTAVATAARNRLWARVAVAGGVAAPFRALDSCLTIAAGGVVAPSLKAETVRPAA